MTWLQFILWITGLYTLYYLAVILLDVSGKERVKAGAAMSNELTFSETVEARLLEPEDAEDSSNANTVTGSQANVEPAMVGSGGVSLKSLFSLAREEAVVYTRPVSFQL